MKNKAIYKPPEGSDIAKDYGIDVEDQLLKILSDELSKSIDKDIMNILGNYINPINETRKRKIEKIRKMRKLNR
jgi:hypothetical protein